MNVIRLINNDQELSTAHDEMERLLNIGSDNRTAEDDERLTLLALVVGAYEDEHHRPPPLDPIDAVLCRMMDLGLQQVDLLEEFGNKTTASQMLGRTRALTLPVIRRLSSRLGLPVSLLTPEYALASDAVEDDEPPMQIAL